VSDVRLLYKPDFRRFERVGERRDPLTALDLAEQEFDRHLSVVLRPERPESLPQIGTRQRPPAFEEHGHLSPIREGCAVRPRWKVGR
jgi:hypothetical protein